MQNTVRTSALAALPLTTLGRLGGGCPTTSRQRARRSCRKQSLLTTCSWRQAQRHTLVALVLLLGAFTLPASVITIAPSAVSSSGSTTIVDLKFFHIAMHGSSLDLAWRLRAQATGGSPAPRELNAWWHAASTVLGQLHASAWDLDLDELLGQGPAPAPQQAAATPTGAAGGDAEAQAEAAAQAAVDGNPEQQMQGLMHCINSQYRTGATMSWQAALADAQASVKVVGAWWHASDGGGKVPITVVTSASMSRLPQLYAQCLSWPGPLSAVLYVGLSAGTAEPQDSSRNSSSSSSSSSAQAQRGKQQQQQPDAGAAALSAADRAALRTAALQISHFMLDMEQEGRHACQPHVILVFERYSDDSARQLLYPCNVPRNLARLQARTPLVALVDVDLVLSHSLYDRFANAQRAEHMIKQVTEGNITFIIPAFDVRGQYERVAWADALVSNTSTKDMLAFAYHKGIVFQFASDTYQVAHNLTNYAHWMHASEDYDVAYQPMSEPWILGDRLRLPWHDARYRGYGLNKQQFVAHVNAAGWKFRVLHDAFTVHRAHKKTRARDVFIKGIRSTGPDPRLFAHNAAMFKAQMILHSNTSDFVTPLHNATAYCLRLLPWWRDSLMTKMLNHNGNQAH